MVEVSKGRAVTRAAGEIFFEVFFSPPHINPVGRAACTQVARLFRPPSADTREDCPPQAIFFCIFSKKVRNTYR